MATRLNVRPEPGKWYVSEGWKAGRNGSPSNEELGRHNTGHPERIVAGPFDDRVQAEERLPALADTYEPFVWQCEAK